MKNFTEFNKQSAEYVKFRPTYPNELFYYLQSITPSNELAYDVGTGNGQCAIALAEYFKKVRASDLSQEQISKALLKENVKYFVSEAHNSGLDTNSVDLITVATAIHWFDLDKFYSECKRIMKKGSVIAVWAYAWHDCENSEVTRLMQKIGQEILQNYWSPQPKLVWAGYKTIAFPFDELELSEFTQNISWNMNELIGYLLTWSASQKYIEFHKKLPTEEIYEDLLKAWGDPNTRLHFKCPLSLRIGKHSL
jgi:ubiquinone/menaquinone biosynthesis C-methylase UbiE